MAKKLSAYEFLKGLGQKTPQKILKEEYIRQRNNIVKAIKRAQKIAVEEHKGIDVNVDIPSVPKRVTEGSFKKLERARYQLTWEKESGDIHELYKERRLKRAAQKSAELLDKKFKEEHPEIYKHVPVKSKGVDDVNYVLVPTVEDKWLSTLELIINKALEETESPKGRQDNFYKVVHHRANIAFEAFDDNGVNDPGKRIEINTTLENLDEGQWSSLQDLLQSWIWYYKPSMTYEPDMNDLFTVLDVMGGRATERQKKWLADFDDSEGFSDMD